MCLDDTFSTAITVYMVGNPYAYTFIFFSARERSSSRRDDYPRAHHCHAHNAMHLPMASIMSRKAKHYDAREKKFLDEPCMDLVGTYVHETRLMLSYAHKGLRSGAAFLL